ncbi:hypothetical protein J0910_14955 [Nocardiopsis sp. CNT-189]|uniref:DUF6069 family protein n=1 Tax=Nocardiopsis oceanisediminis TaxID=2816862 RepID=UPI003B2F6CD1
MTGAPSTALSLIRVRAATVVAAAAAALAVWAVADPLLGIPLIAQGAPGRPPMEVGPVPVLAVSVGSALAGWALLALLEGFTARGRTVWTVIAVAVVLLSLVPVLGGRGTAVQVILASQHVLVGGIVIAGFTRTPGR